MAQLSTFLILVVGAAAFWLLVPLWRLYPAMQPMVTALSIIAAALLVRLNRGIPTIDWKAIAPDTRKKLTAQMEAIAKEYVVILGIAAALTILLVALQVVGLEAIRTTWWVPAQAWTSALIGGLATLSVVRMAYVVWRDFDIVRMQRQALDAAADADQVQLEKTIADGKIAAIKGSGLRAVPRSEPQAWED